MSTKSVKTPVGNKLKAFIRKLIAKLRNKQTEKERKREKGDRQIQTDTDSQRERQ